MVGPRLFRYLLTSVSIYEASYVFEATYLGTLHFGVNYVSRSLSAGSVFHVPTGLRPCLYCQWVATSVLSSTRRVHDYPIAFLVTLRLYVATYLATSICGRRTSSPHLLAPLNPPQGVVTGASMAFNLRSVHLWHYASSYSWGSLRRGFRWCCNLLEANGRIHRWMYSMLRSVHPQRYRFCLRLGVCTHG